MLILIIVAFAAESAMAQTKTWREMHKVKRKETIFGIARDYGITVEDLINANPEMKMPGYELKKGDFIFIPYAKDTKLAQTGQPVAAVVHEEHSAKHDKDVRQREIRLGVMLPLHDINGDGRRMVEYYRGVLMACDSLKKDGLSIDVSAWNLPEDADISNVLKEPSAAKCDIIIGPLYSKQVAALSEFVTTHGIKLLIPFSIVAPELKTNPNIFQVYQNQEQLTETTIDRFMERFKGHHAVIIDCNDSTSKKGMFTAPLRKRMEEAGMTYTLTNTKSTEGMFAKAFSLSKPNVVILNTGRSPELNLVMAKLDNLTMNHVNMNISLFGYTEWMMYTKYQLDNFYKYDTYIPAAYYLNPLSNRTMRIEQKYRWNFHADMMQAIPRFAITGFDQAYYMLKGLHMYGENFTGATGMVGYLPVQTPLRFEKCGNGGFQNKSLLFVHYTKGHRMETINF